MLVQAYKFLITVRKVKGNQGMDETNKVVSETIRWNSGSPRKFDVLIYFKQLIHTLVPDT